MTYDGPTPLGRRASLVLGLLALGLGGAVSGCDGILGDPPPETDPPPSNPEDAELQPPVLPKLTEPQYRTALITLFGEVLPQTPVQPDTNPFLFTSIGATTDPLSEIGVQQLEEAADVVTHYVFDDPTRRSALVGCEPASPGDACVEGFLRTFGRRALRHTLTEAEVTKWRGISADLSGGDAWVGVRTAVAGILQSPAFVYRIELGEPDVDDPDRLRYTGFEMASRLSFLLWNAPPDDALLDAAEAGELDDAAGVSAAASRLIEDPRARVSIQEFFAQYLDLGKLDGITRDEDLYPDFSPELAEAMRTEAKLLVDDLVFRRDRDMRELFSTRHTFVNADLAELYGVEAPGATSIAFVPVELPADGPRAGLLTLGAFLTMNAHEATTAPTLRGKYLRERVLCLEVAPPPPDVNAEIDQESGETNTLRERLEQHRDNPACSGCHSLLDPPGFLFENFDSIGRYRTMEGDFPVDASGEFDGEPLANARELADVLANEERVGQCIVKQLFRHAQGRLDAEGEEPALDGIVSEFESSGYRFRALLVALVADESFRFVAPAVSQ